MQLLVLELFGFVLLHLLIFYQFLFLVLYCVFQQLEFALYHFQPFWSLDLLLFLYLCAA